MDTGGNGRRRRARYARVAAGAFLGLALAVGGGGPAAAQAPAPAPAPGAPALPEPLTPEAVRELVARLSDAEVRQLLLAQLDRAAAPAGAAAAPDAGMVGMMETAERRIDRLRRGVGELGGAAVALPRTLYELRARFLEGRGNFHLLVVAAFFAAALALGGLAEALVRRLTRATRQRLETEPAEDLATQAAHVGLRLALELLALAAFTGGVLALFFAVYQGHLPTRLLVLTSLGAIVLVRLVAAGTRILLAPGAPGLRLLPFDETAAQALHAGAIRLAAVYAAGTGVAGLARKLGAPASAASLLQLVAATAFLVLLLRALWQVRGAVGALIRGSGGGSRRLLAELWLPLAAAYLVTIFGALLLEVAGGGPPMSWAPIVSVLLLVALPLADMVLGRLVGALVFGRAPGQPPDPASYEPVAQRAVHIVVVVSGLLVLARLWGLDLFALARRGLGAQISSALLGIAITLLLAHLLWEVVQTSIDRRMRREGGPVSGEPGEEGGNQPASRLRTLLPLFRMLLLATIAVMATLSVLAALGVNILPLLAGASVVGLAIGFGSQALVRDVVSGAFFLIDDAFRLGEYVEMGDAKGVVERITIRSLQLRHHRGAIHILPYGEIRRIVNVSRDWMIMKLEFRLPFDTDLVKVKKILKRIGEELSEDPEMGPNLLQPLKSQGVTATDDSALIVRAKFMARPGAAPYLIRREAYTRILKAFAEAGIHFANRQVTVYAVPGAAPSPAAALGGAAAVLGDGPQR
jgi:small-conductance mechanosensitive channel